MRLALVVLLITLKSMAAQAAPVAYWANDPVDPDDTVAVSGAGLENIRSIQIGRVADNGASSQEQFKVAQVLHAGPSELTFVVPPSLAKGVFEWRADDNGATLQGFLNAPTVYWMQGNLGLAASPGGWVRVMGRNIVRSKQAQLELRDSNGASRRVTAREGDLWDATFPIPSDLKPGRLSLTLSNGQGGVQAWRDAGFLEIRNSPQAPQTVLDVRQFGAKADFKTDDSDAMEKALEAASHVTGGAVVRVPPGSYKLTRQLTIPDGVVLSGESRETSFLEWADTPTPPPALIEGFSNFTIENLTIVSGRHFNVIRGGFPRPGNSQDGDNIALRNVRVRALGFVGHLSPDDEGARQRNALAFSHTGVDTLGLAGSNLVVENCDVLGAGRSLYLLRPRGARVQGNSFANGRQGWYSISGAEGVIFTNNDVFGADLESTGGGINTLFAHASSSTHVLVKGNRFRRFFGWDREALTTDGPGGYYFGHASASGDKSLTLLEAPKAQNEFPDWRGAGVFVMLGSGVGEWARVTAREGAKVDLDRPLPTAPDESSLITIVPMQGQDLIVGNEFEDAEYAVQLFGTAVETVIANNRSSRTTGYFVKSIDYHHVQPSWYNQVLNNIIQEPGLTGIASIGLGVWGRLENVHQSLALNLMTIVRGNKLAANSQIELRGLPPYPSLTSGPIVEHNVLDGPTRGIVRLFGVHDPVVRANTVGDGATQSSGPTR